MDEAADFKRRYEEDVQFIFSHVQHHWHALNDLKERVPTKYCSIRGKKCPGGQCKRGFPRRVLKDKKGKLRQEKYRMRIVCRGVAAELGLRCSGRRNMLGAVLGKRRCQWFSGTSALLAHVFRSNTNIQTNYRIPLTAATHDRDCKRTTCFTEANFRQLLLVAQKANMCGCTGTFINDNL